MRRIAPGCQSAGASGGGAHSMLPIRQPEVLHPGSEHIAKDAAGLLDVEVRGLLFWLHERWSPARYGWHSRGHFPERNACPARLENA